MSNNKLDRILSWCHLEDSGVADAIATIAVLRHALPSGTPLVIGGRVTLATMPEVLVGSDGAIIGSALKTSTGYSARVEPGIARRFGAAGSARLAMGATAPTASDIVKIK